MSGSAKRRGRWLAAGLLMLGWLSGGLAIAGDAVWKIDLPIEPEAQQVIALGNASFTDQQALLLTYERENTHVKQDVWVELSLTTCDGRYFATAAPLTIPGENHRADLRIAFDAGHWCGHDGSLGGDALAAVRELRVRLHGTVPNGRLSGTLSVVAATAAAPAFSLQVLDGGLVGRGPWKELRLRLLGAGGERGEVSLVAPGEAGKTRNFPLFFDQPGAVIDGHWRARGPGRWVLRLRSDEILPPASRIAWDDGRSTWNSPPLPAGLELVGTQAIAPAPPELLPIPQAPAWNGFPCVIGADGKSERLAQTKLDACPAPILAWLASWTGFRGPQAISYEQAAGFDLVLAAGAGDLDLLPQGLFEEHGAFRFGLTPWNAVQGGPWEFPQDALHVDAPWRQWRGHVREVLARARATPGLTRWRLGLTQAANTPADVERLRLLVGDLARLVARLDGRPLLVLHPQATDYAFIEPRGVWFDFEDGVQGWRYGPLPFKGTPTIGKVASDGQQGLSLPIPVGGVIDGVRAVGVMREIDASLFNLDRIEFDANLAGAGTAQLYAWVTDQYHHWYQQRLDLIDGNRRWNTVGVDFTDEAAWQAVGHTTPWSTESRRRVRRFGITVFFRAKGAADLPATLALDRFRRMGWAAEATPRLELSDLKVNGGESVACWQPIAADFRLSVEARNPFDPDSADVAAEVIAPDGKRLRYPAYWSEPFALEFANGVERAAPAGGGGAWHWRFSPSAPGAWRWRLVARVQYRDHALEMNGDWRTTTVSPAPADAMLPIRVSAKDRAYFETVDGKWFYPVGINLRSPGDSRQDHVLAELASAQPHAAESSGLFRSSDYDRLGTRAYERWFPIMERNRLNWARVWMCPWWCGIEWRRDWDGFGGLTSYSQAAAARLDRVLELARAHHVYIQLELQNHGMTSSHVDEQWEDSPYNAANGGPCRHDWDYFSSAEAWAVHAKRLRYIQARWGWNSHLAAWVLSSEMEFTGAWWSEAGREAEGHSPTTQAWIEKSLAWFAANDPLGRPVSIHFSHPWQGAQLWKMPGLGFSNSNAYTGFQQSGRLGGERSGLSGALLAYLSDHFPPASLHRPTVVGEWGGHWEVNPSSTLSAELHTGVWMQAVLPYGGNTGFWWWLWVDAAGRWSDYAPVAAFVAGEDPRAQGYQSYRPVVLAERQHTASVVGMKAEREQRYYASLPGLSRDLTERSDQDAGTARIASEQPGSVWHVERWDCASGRVVEQRDLIADDQGLLSLPLGVLNPDAAFKLHRTGGGAH